MAWPPQTHQDVQDRIDQLTIPGYFRSGYYSLGHFTGLGLSNPMLSTTSAYLRPFLVLATQTFDRIGINVAVAATSGSGGLIQTAIFQPGPLPGAKLLETATLSSETSGPKEWTINQTLTPGIWWLGVRSVVSSCNATGISSSEHASPFVQYETVPPTSTSAGGSYSYSVAGSTPGFPSSGAAPFGTSATFPLVSLRAA